VWQLFLALSGTSDLYGVCLSYKRRKPDQSNQGLLVRREILVVFPLLAMHFRVTCGTEGDQVVLGIVSGLASMLFMVDRILGLFCLENKSGIPFFEMVRKGTEGTRRSSRMPSSETEALMGSDFGRLTRYRQRRSCSRVFQSARMPFAASAIRVR
jgi:hypothetical protein